MNDVVLEGRLSKPAEERVLPSGDRVVTWRLVIPRDRPHGKQTVDVIDCAAWTARVRRKALRWPADSELRVEGSLRRRFWQGGAGSQSRVEVEVREAAKT